MSEESDKEEESDNRGKWAKNQNFPWVVLYKMPPKMIKQNLLCQKIQKTFLRESFWLISARFMRLKSN